MEEQKKYDLASREYQTAKKNMSAPAISELASMLGKRYGFDRFGVAT